ncbi:DUF5802 family protein [Natronorubrum bangense]|uniref:Uncharacterized protein n=2 Tax=Natronorubrum bangense TaxID=61858 RepID=L9WNF7_9EURY|nr:DUF5802 family protein [Natronorubrum bangense]ELY49883.1 hypothetical protein C494_07730 [Natronorubrum bangense JCM 10635]QCC55502.1 hypothetical protein DV706_14105 [Natronorubrum bangense]
MVESFSSKYYLTQINVIPYSGDRAVIDIEWAEQLRRKYANTYPLVFKLAVGSAHIPTYGEAGVPARTLAVPKELFESLNVDETEPTNVLLAKERTVDQLISLNLVDCHA